MANLYRKGYFRAAITAGFLAAAQVPTAAHAGYLISISGTFDQASGTAASLDGTAYSAGFFVGTTPSSVTRYVIDPLNSHAGFDYIAPYSSSLTTINGTLGYNATDGNTLDYRDNFSYDGSAGFVPAGTYDLVSITGHLKNNNPPVTPGCVDSSISATQCFPQGFFLEQTLTLIGTTDMFSGLSAPLLDRIDFAKVIYGVYGFARYSDGVQVGQAMQDPPLSFSNGTFSGEGMLGSVAFVADVPEPATWALMLIGFAFVGYAMRRQNAPSVSEWVPRRTNLV